MPKPGYRFPPLAIRAQLRWDVVEPIIRRLSPETTIEIGVGQGAMSARIASITGRSYIGFELDQDSFQRARPRIEQVGGRLHSVPLVSVDPAAADLLCAFEVLEHIEDDHAALRSWVRYILPGGHLL